MRKLILILFISITSICNGQITKRNSLGSQNGAGSTTINMTIPTGVTNGDLLIMVVTGRAGTIVPGDVAGWTTFGSSCSNTTICSKLYFRVASSEPASYSVGLTTSQKASGIIIALYNAESTLPLSGNQISGPTSSINTTANFATLSTWSSSNGMDLVFGTLANSSTLTPPTNYTIQTQIQSSGGGGPSTKSSTSLATRVLTSATTVGALTGTWGTSAVNISFHIFIKEVLPAAKPRRVTIVSKK